MNKFNKGKLIGVVAASLSAVSLMGVGFATWIIGTQNKESDGKIAIEADDVSYKSLKVGVEFAGKIRLAETTTASNLDDVFSFKGTNDEKGNFTVSAKFTFTLGKDFVDSDFDFAKINLSILSAAEAGEGFKDNTADKNDVKITRTGTAATNPTYFDCPTDIAIAKSDLNFTTTVTGKYKTTECTKDITFKWGNMFGEGGPNAYYNAGCKALTGETKKDKYLEDAYDELKAMHNKYSSTDSKIKLKIELA